MKRHWIAVCLGESPETGRLLASCLTFWASNRFDALSQVTHHLPDHENWVGPDGKLRTYHLLTLEQCPTSEAEERAMFYMGILCKIIEERSVSSAHSA